MDDAGGLPLGEDPLGIRQLGGVEPPEAAGDWAAAGPQEVLHVGTRTREDLGSVDHVAEVGEKAADADGQGGRDGAAYGEGEGAQEYPAGRAAHELGASEVHRVAKVPEEMHAKQRPAYMAGDKGPQEGLRTGGRAQYRGGELTLDSAPTDGLERQR